MDAPIRLWRYADLHELKIVSSRSQLRRLVERRGFPSGFYLGPCTRVWNATDVETWLRARREAAARQASAPQVAA